MPGPLLAVVAAAPRVLAQAGTGATETLHDSCGLQPTSICRWVYDRWGAGPADVVDLFDQPLHVLVIFAVAWLVNRLVRAFIKRAMTRAVSERSLRRRQALRKATPTVLLRTDTHNLRLEARVQTLTTVLRSVASVIIWFVAAVAALKALTIDLTTLVAPASIIGVALGFGAQNIVKDFLAGTFIVVEDQFGVGDVVDLGGEAKGTVEALTLRSTRVRDVHGTVWHVPNGQIVRAANKSQEWARALLDLEVDGSTDYAVAAPIVRRVAEAMGAEQRWMVEILETPEVWGVESFTDRGYTIRLVVKTRPASQFGVMRELRLRLLTAFHEAGIVMAGDQWAVEHPDDIDVLRQAVLPPPPAPAGARTASATSGAADRADEARGAAEEAGGDSGGSGSGGDD